MDNAMYVVGRGPKTEKKKSDALLQRMRRSRILTPPLLGFSAEQNNMHSAIVDLAAGG